MQIQERDKLYHLVAWELDFVCCLQKCKLYSLSSPPASPFAQWCDEPLRNKWELPGMCPTHRKISVASRFLFFCSLKENNFTVLLAQEGGGFL